jgi:hypothetical protein
LIVVILDRYSDEETAEIRRIVASRQFGSGRDRPSRPTSPQLATRRARRLGPARPAGL